MKKLSLMIVLVLFALSKTYAYEIVDDGIMLNGIVYPTELSGEQLTDIDTHFPNLIDFLLTSEAINDEEKTYQLSLLPLMDDAQRQKLYDILVNERRQLEALNERYEAEIEALNKSPVDE